MNFQTILEELDRLYEEDCQKTDLEEAAEDSGYVVGLINAKGILISLGYNVLYKSKKEAEDAAAKVTSKDKDAEIKVLSFDQAKKIAADDKVVYATPSGKAFIGAKTAGKLTEADEEVLIDEEPIIDDEVEETPIDEAPRQLVIECAKCGAIFVKNEEEVVVDEATDLANIDDKCQYCEETEGYKIVGEMVPYEGAVVAEETDETVAVDETEDVAEIDEDLLVRGENDKLTTTSQEGRWGNSKEWDYNNEEYTEATEQNQEDLTELFGFSKNKKNTNRNTATAESTVTISLYDENGTKQFSQVFKEIEGKKSAEEQFNEVIKSNGLLNRYKSSAKKNEWSYERKSNPPSSFDTDKYFNTAAKIIKG